MHYTAAGALHMDETSSKHKKKSLKNMHFPVIPAARVIEAANTTLISAKSFSDRAASVHPFPDVRRCVSSCLSYMRL